MNESCTYIDRIDAYYDAALDASEAAQIKEHLRACPTCADRLRQLEQITVLFTDSAQDTMPFASKSRLITTVRAAVDRAPSRFAWEMTGIAASVLVAATIWLATVPSSAQAGANWERAAATGGRSIQTATASTQPTETQFASWVVSDLNDDQTQGAAMKQWKLLVALAMCLAFVAGAVIGLGRSRLQDRTTIEMDHGPGGGPPEMHLSEELNLSSQQRQQMRDIWESLMQDGPRLDEQSWDLEKRYRDQAQSLLTPDQKQKYDAIVAEYQQASAKLDVERRGNFAAAVEKTKALLTPEQREKYEQVLMRHHGPDDPGGPGGHGGPGGPPHGHGGPGGPGGPHGDEPDLLGAEMHGGPGPDRHDHGDH